MTLNPYEPPSYLESYDELARHAASQFVANARSSSLFHFAGGLLLLVVPLIVGTDSDRPPAHPAQLATAMGVGVILIVWGALQYHANIVAVTLTGLAAAGTVLFFAAFMIQQFRNDGSVVGSIAIAGAGALLTWLLSWPIRLAGEGCVRWWFHGLDPKRIASGGAR